MNVLVIGAAGVTGRLVVASLAESIHHHAKAMVRRAEQIADMEKLGVKPVLADLEQDFSYAMNDMNAVIFAAGSGSSTGLDKTMAVDRNGAIKAIDLAKVHGIKRFIMLSSIGADNPDAGPGDFRHYLQAKYDADQHLINSGLNYTIVRPGRLTNDSPAGCVEAALKIKDASQSISRSDVADVLVQCLLAPSTEEKVFEVVSGTVPIPEALKQL